MVHAGPLKADARPLNTVLLLGPTASGKSAAAMALAQRLPIEIVSVDSACVYRGMDIGTAKPDAAEQERVPHHLIDLIDPWDAYSAARFVADAGQAIARIRARGRLPLLVGGTMLYVRALIDGFDDLPQADPQLRARLDAEAAAQGWPTLHARLATLDPETARRLAPNDSQRIQRALEIIETTGTPMSQLLMRRQREDRGSPADAGFTVVALEPAERAPLHQRIARRFEAMLAAGLVDEVRRLRATGRLNAQMPSMRCVGYRQVWEMLEGQATEAQMIERGIAATRQLAKRQLTWLRSMPTRIVIDCNAADAGSRAVSLLERELAAH